MRSRLPALAEILATARKRGWPPPPAACIGENEYLRRAMVEGQLATDDPRPESRWPPYQRFADVTRALAARDRLVKEYAWAIPNDPALAALIEWAPLVEIGAGGGYWAKLLRERGADVVAYDPHPPPHPRGSPLNKVTRRVWTDVRRGGPEAAARHGDRTLFLCWPPQGKPAAIEALATHCDAGGCRVAYIGEPSGGFSATERFFRLLDTRYRRVGELIVPRWYRTRDILALYELRSTEP